MSSSLELHPRGLNHSLVLQRHTCQTAVMLAVTLAHMRSNDYSTTKIFVDNFLLSTLSIMLINRCSPTKNANYYTFIIYIGYQMLKDHLYFVIKKQYWSV